MAEEALGADHRHVNRKTAKSRLRAGAANDLRNIDSTPCRSHA